MRLINPTHKKPLMFEGKCILGARGLKGKTILQSELWTLSLVINNFYLDKTIKDIEENLIFSKRVLDSIKATISTLKFKETL